MIAVPKNNPPKSTNDQLISNLKHVISKSLSYWLSGLYEQLKEHYSLHLNSPILLHSGTKIEIHYIFMKKSPKYVTVAQRYPEFYLLTRSMLCQVWKSYAGQWWPGMITRTCNQHWFREQGWKPHYFCDGL